MVVSDVYFLALHEPYRSAQHPVPINAVIVHARTLLHPALPQPDGSLMYRCLTEFPDRCPGCVVPLSTLTFELDGGRNWSEIGDWEQVVEHTVRLARTGRCDAMPLGLPDVTAALLANGPTTAVRFGGRAPVDPAERQRHLDDLAALVKQAARQGAFWPGDDLVPVPALPEALPYQPHRAGRAGFRFSWQE
ncbi:hypothetical protein SAMN05421505_15815 [Sinosporangium album]|uniref:Uncharacterized protein n=1 Tax=Sinosporangium album TaxID=504805 RepID=A0A1G8KZ12_9ACTN|nr:hypothetical protein [Sinosporangium album]SDI48629.1 hypothetical protein SAMN05421505_15815 [Sinosporangium album]